MTAQDQRTPIPAKDQKPFVPVWLRRRNEQGQAKDLTGAVKAA